MDPRFAHIRDWIFDLDNCLYPASAGLFDLIDERMSAYIQRLLDCGPEEAKRVQKAHFHEHGTTLAGLIEMLREDPPAVVIPGHGPPLEPEEALGIAENDLAYLRKLHRAVIGAVAGGATREEVRSEGLAVELPRPCAPDLEEMRSVNVERQIEEILADAGADQSR